MNVSGAITSSGQQGRRPFKKNNHASTRAYKLNYDSLNRIRKEKQEESKRARRLEQKPQNHGDFGTVQETVFPNQLRTVSFEEEQGAMTANNGVLSFGDLQKLKEAVDTCADYFERGIGSWEGVQKAVEFMRQLTTVKGRTVSDIIKELLAVDGLLPSLMFALQCHDLNVQHDATWMLINMTFSTGAEQIASHPMLIGHVARLMYTSRYDPITNQCIWIFGNIASKSPFHRKMILVNENAHDVLHGVINSDLSLQDPLLQTSIWTLQLLLKDSGSLYQQQDSYRVTLQFTRPVLKLLKRSFQSSPNQELLAVQADACGCLNSLADGGRLKFSERAHFLLKSGALPTLMELLAHLTSSRVPKSHFHLCRQLVRCIKQFACGTAEQVAAVQAAGFLAFARKLLKISDVDVCTLTLCVLANIAMQPGLLNQVEQKQVFKHLVANADPTQHYTIKCEALSLLVDLVNHQNDYVHGASVVKVMCENLKSRIPDSQILLRLLRCLKSLLVGTSEAVKDLQEYSDTFGELALNQNGEVAISAGELASLITSTESLDSTSDGVPHLGEEEHEQHFSNENGCQMHMD